MTYLLILLLITPSTQSSNVYTDITTKVLQQTHKGCTVLTLQENTRGITMGAIKSNRIGTSALDLSQLLNELHIDEIVLKDRAEKSTLKHILQSLNDQKNCYYFAMFGSVKYIKRNIEAIRASTSIFALYYFILIAEEDGSGVTGGSVESLFEIENGVFIKIYIKTKVVSVYDIRLGFYTRRQMLSDDGYLLDRPAGFPTLNRKQLKAGFLIKPPFIFEISEPPGLDGLDIKVLTTFSVKLNFTFVFVPAKDGEWGRDKNGTWTGLIGQVLYREADMSMCSLGITLPRERVIDFTREFYYDITTFVVPTPGLAPQWQSLIRPFDFLTWILTFVFLILIFIVFYITSKVNHKLASTPTPLSLPSRCFMVCVRIVCTENVKVLPLDFPSRIVLGAWLTGATIILSCYAGLITSLLINPIRTKPISTIDDLAYQNLVKWGKINYGGNPEMFFMTSTIPSYQKIWKEMIFVKDTTECTTRTFTESFACIDSTSGMVQGYNKAAKKYEGKSSALFAAQYFFSYNLGIALPPGSPLKEYFDDIILILMEAGIVTKWLDEMDGLPKKGKKVDDKDPVILTLNHLTGAFYLWFLGLGLAVVGFTFNVAKNRLKAEKQLEVFVTEQ